MGFPKAKWALIRERDTAAVLIGSHPLGFPKDLTHLQKVTEVHRNIPFHCSHSF